MPSRRRVLGAKPEPNHLWLSILGNQGFLPAGVLDTEIVDKSWILNIGNDGTETYGCMPREDGATALALELQRLIAGRALLKVKEGSAAIVLLIEWFMLVRS